MAETIKNAIVLNLHEISDNEHIVSFFTAFGRLDLVARGLNNVHSKNRSNLIVGSIVEIEYFASRTQNKYGRLKKSSTIKLLDVTNLNNIKLFNSLNFLFQNIRTRNHLFAEYNRHFDSFNNVLWTKVSTYFYAHSLLYFGIDLSFNSCKRCGRIKDFISFDFNLGFICQNHDITQRLDVPVLQAIWYSFNDFYAYVNDVNSEINKLIFIEYKKQIINHLNISK
ncbi:DNA repair protein RecO [Mycoplasma sp. 2704]|uniref:DNA repair protein RecO n=1 Tax=Mycoplasma sp. 2704 TaxID=3108529 RepID=UPI002B1D1E39|nr:DNA repair protein RecO [Mycoplasma sp. 2704]MEA4134588.1 DNA repair protein RecO [Mycoplasma sp. 2704]